MPAEYGLPVLEDGEERPANKHLGSVHSSKMKGQRLAGLVQSQRWMQPHHQQAKLILSFKGENIDK